MNRHHREEGKSGRDVGLIGEKQEKVSGYDTKAWHPVDKMLQGDHPTTHMGTIACAGGHMGGHHKFKDGGHVMAEQKRMVEGHKEGGSVHHKREMEYKEPKGGHTGPTMKKKGGHMKSHFAAGGVGKERKGQY